MKKTTLSRQEFYELVWSEPLSKLAQKFNISDNGLRKRCKKLNIPLPEVGYWQKLQYNKPVNRPGLPKKNPSGLEVISLFERDNDNPSENSPASRIKNIKNSYTKLNPKIFTVPLKLSDPDKLIIAAKNTLSKEKASELSHWVVNTRFNQVEIKVSPATIDRSLCLFDSLIKFLRLRGHYVSASGCNIEGEHIEIAIREKLRIEKNKDHHGWTIHKYFPTGKLILKIGWSHNIYTKEFIDGKKLLEEKLRDILAFLEYRGQVGKEERIRREIEQAKKAELERIRKEQKARKEQELKNFKNLIKESQSWHKSVILDKYIQEVERKATENNTLTEDLKLWLTWAKQKSKWFNPFIKKEDELLDDDDRYIF